ncbi:tetratricopeptide repeat protein [Desulfoprunum benzoelyticum]|uniref:Tetratricopeptide repeat protein n=1 Tax=Desulfoprunum benzoelyticum TaxID=1506996 RepID=A0A840UVT8_9BACT|nr:tetratricopeptide repeat protein [Desulfoprunum benzoelyticum]MBB5348953.1 hypothetical protein [Desulfoprunum benzoelyticum]MBM9530795.1 tetratricopeptide repeat protein [Desulfoprunum benzoelyticum]
MNKDSFDSEKIEMLLRRHPEHDVPPGLQQRIIASLPLGNRPEGIAFKLKSWWDRLMLPAPMPMKAGAVVAMIAAAFWLGTEVESRQKTGETALQVESTGMETAAGNSWTDNRIGMDSLEDQAGAYAIDFSSDETLSRQKSNNLDDLSDIFLSSEAVPIEDRQNFQAAGIPRIDSTLFLLNLAHNLADSGNYHGALHQYEKVLRLNPQDQTALYNRATSYHHLNDQEGERLAFLSYLDQFRSGRWAYQAVDHLQRLGVFDYQTCMIGGRKVVVNQAILLGSSPPARQRELERLVPSLRRPLSGELHLVVFYQNDLQKSRTIATELKQQIHSILGEDRALPIKTSWFDEAAPVQTGTGEKRELKTGLFLFTQPSTQQRSTI